MRARLALIILATSGCAHHGARAAAEPDYRPIAGEPAPPHAALYADCLADAVAHRTYERAHDADTEVLMFHCHGAPARAFFDALGPWSARIGSQTIRQGRTYRSTNRVQHDLFGVDVCSAYATAGLAEPPIDEASCTISLNAGPFLVGAP